MRSLRHRVCQLAIMMIIGILCEEARASCPNSSYDVPAATGVSGVRVQLHRNNSASAWQGCLTVGTCVWETSNAVANLPLEPEYMPSGHLQGGSPCGLRVTGRGGTTKSCSGSARLAATLKLAAELIAVQWKPQCTNTSSVEQVLIGGEAFLRLPVMRTEACMTLYVRQSDGAAAVALSADLRCANTDIGLAMVVPDLDPLSPTVVAGTADFSRRIALRLPLNAPPVSVALSAGEAAYIDNVWLPALGEILANHPDAVSASTAPLPEDGGSSVGFYLNYLAAAALRLDWHENGNTAPAPVDRFDQVSSWMADTALSSGVDRRNSFFRAELAK